MSWLMKIVKILTIIPVVVEGVKAIFKKAKDDYDSQ